MNKQREIWWSYARGMIRQYPQLRAEYLELHQQSLTAEYSGMPKSEGSSRTTENIALRELPPKKQREYEAVDKAITATKQLANGALRLKLIKEIYWTGGKKIESAACSIPCSEATAWRWHGDFVRLVMEFRG